MKYLLIAQSVLLTVVTTALIFISVEVSTLNEDITDIKRDVKISNSISQLKIENYVEKISNLEEKLSSTENKLSVSIKNNDYKDNIIKEFESMNNFDNIGGFEMFKNVENLPVGCPIEETGFYLTSNFGPRPNPFSSNKKTEFHNGLDLKGVSGAQIFSTADGYVKHYYVNNKVFGNMLIIDHGNGYETRYAHLGYVKVRKGMKVKKGQFLGRQGKTGITTGSHLHYEVRYEDEPINPMIFVQQYLGYKSNIIF